MITSELTTKAQTTIPQFTRAALRLKKGDELADEETRRGNQNDADQSRHSQSFGIAAGVNNDPKNGSWLVWI